MTKETEIQSAERRNFLKLTATGGFTAAVVAGSAGTLWSSKAVAQTARREQELQAAAEHTMTIATAYRLDAELTYPMMQLTFKDNIQNATGGKVYVKLAPDGQLGAGSALVQKVQGGTIQAAQHSLSNFAPFVPSIDMINLPYFCGANQNFVNLVHSQVWKDNIDASIEEKGFKPLFYVVIDPRVVAVRRGGAGAVITPSDLKGVKFRVPGSPMLQQYYKMVGANPTPVAWGETPSAIKQGVADALDPSVGALEVFGFKDILSHVTFTQAVPDSQMYSCNLEWFNSMPADIQDGIMEASEMTAHQNLSMVRSARTAAMLRLREAGVEFHSLSDDQLAEWKAAGGHQRPEWDEFKTELVGSVANFDKFAEAAETRGQFYVHDA